MLKGLVLCLLAGPLLADPLACSLVPGWTQEGAARSFVADNLFEYMDGNAEGYLIYGFQKMDGVTCKKGEVTLVIDLSEMGTPDSAWGILTANRDARQPAAPIGMGGQIVPRRAIFAKGSRYLEIAANPEGDHTETLKTWTAAIEKLLPGDTSTPKALTWFPQSGQTGIRLIPESVLGLRLLKRGYVAQYDYGKAFLVQESAAVDATATMQKLRTRFGGVTAVTIADEAFTFEDRYLGKLCFFRRGKYVGGWANVAAAQDAEGLARTLAEKIP